MLLHLSASQIGRRRQRLEAAGYIEGYRARLSSARLGLDVQAFVTVQMATHAPEKVKTFTRIVETRAEITSAWTMTGEADYLLAGLLRRSGGAERADPRGSVAASGGGAGAKPDRHGSVEGGRALADLTVLLIDCGGGFAPARLASPPKYLKQEEDQLRVGPNKRALRQGSGPRRCQSCPPR